MIAQAEVVTEVAKGIHWQELGIVGVVIAALFGVLYYQLRESAKERKETRDCHREERTEWREGHKDFSERLEASVNKLTDAIHELSKR